MASTSGGASWNGTRLRLPGTVTSLAFQVLKNQSFCLAKCAWMRPIVCRNATASSIDSLVSVGPPRPSIIADVMSFDAMIVYSGDVDACIMNDSLKRACGIALRPSRMCRNDACDNAASSLCVECVANTVGPVWSFGSPRMPYRLR